MRDSSLSHAPLTFACRWVSLSSVGLLLLCLLLAQSCNRVQSEMIVYPKNWPLPKLVLPEFSKRAPLLVKAGSNAYTIGGVVMNPGQIRFGIGFKNGHGWSRVGDELDLSLKNLGFRPRRGPGSIHYYSSSDRTMDVRVIVDEQKDTHFTIIVDVYDKPQSWML